MTRSTRITGLGSVKPHGRHFDDFGYLSIWTSCRRSSTCVQTMHNPNLWSCFWLFTLKMASHQSRPPTFLQTAVSPDSVASTKTDVLSTQAVWTTVQSQTVTHLLDSTHRHVQLTSNLSLHMYQPLCHFFQLKTWPSDSNLAHKPNYNAMRHNLTSLSREPSQTNCQSSQQPVNMAHNPSVAEEFGQMGGQGSLVRRTLADEILTPDTSKYYCIYRAPMKLNPPLNRPR